MAIIWKVGFRTVVLVIGQLSFATIVMILSVMPTFPGIGRPASGGKLSVISLEENYDDYSRIDGFADCNDYSIELLKFVIRYGGEGFVGLCRYCRMFVFSRFYLLQGCRR